MRAVAYTRVSTQEQVTDGVSLAMQDERIRAYCKLQGIEVAELVTDAGVSGAVPLQSRPAGWKVEKALKRHKAHHIVALKLDRLFRSAEDALRHTKAWDNAGIALHLVDMGGQSINTASAMGRMMLTMMAAFAEFERNMIAERTRDALQHKRKHLKVYNHEPFGLRRKGEDLVPVATEQKIITRIKSARAEKRTLRDIADELNYDKVATKIAGGRWYASTVANVLRLAGPE
jgi:DNA invertase Pin-like site-specific DNA recombinase